MKTLVRVIQNIPENEYVAAVNEDRKKTDEALSK